MRRFARIVSGVGAQRANPDYRREPLKKGAFTKSGFGRVTLCVGLLTVFGGPVTVDVELLTVFVGLITVGVPVQNLRDFLRGVSGQSKAGFLLGPLWRG